MFSAALLLESALGFDCPNPEFDEERPLTEDAPTHLRERFDPPFFGPLSWQVQRQSGPQAIAAAQTPSVVEASFAVLLPSSGWGGRNWSFLASLLPRSDRLAAKRILTPTKSSANANPRISLRTNEMTRMIRSNVPGSGVQR